MFTVRAMIVSFGFPYGIIGFFIAIIFSCLRVNSGRALNDYILHFEPVFFDQHHVKDHHRRSIRSTMDRYIQLQFVAYKRVFRLLLERDPWVFADHTEFISSESTVQYDTSRALTGYVEGEENSSVQGVLLSTGLFDGTIRIGNEELYVEPSQNYFSTPRDFHSVIYRLSDVRYPETNRTCATPTPPTSKLRHHHSSSPFSKTRLHKSRLRYQLLKMPRKRISNSSEELPSLQNVPSNIGSQQSSIYANNEMNPNSQHLHQEGHRTTNFRTIVEGGVRGYSPEEVDLDDFQADATSSRSDENRLHYWRDLDSLHYTESGGGGSSSEPYGVRSVQRTQWPEEGSRRGGSVAVDRRKSTCLLYLQADHLFYRRLGGEEACIDAMTRHVQRVNSIYRNTEQQEIS